MSGAARNTGSKLVAGAVTLTVAAVGVGTIYLPFVADRDRLRGMHEEREMSGKDREEYERALREMSMKVDPQQSGPCGGSVVPAPPPLSNSMWKRMNQAALASSASSSSSSSGDQGNKRP
jgi:hypothetical protein